ncbi:hypothetical protein [Reichenbachiella sp. MSK19-1]|uniref:hypothetical protein n=1 Tax=Reichenbachiella sp. MSK19-1 TaxID=1897631 RepID=UPI000E6C5968|nr:hypothetical protein [Reichenbachiella sp. MSK19-1]RJE71886.1 hypothetical protein BGP76_07315 [Reichenbachiella sp. MSK19-1]
MKHYDYPKLIPYIIGSLSLLLLSRCSTEELTFDDIKLPNYTGDVVLALGTTTFTTSELIEDLDDEQLDVDTTQAGILVLVYRDTTIFSDANEIIAIDDVSNNGLIESPIEITNASSSEAGDFKFTQNLQFNYPISNGEELDSLLYASGSISITYESTFNVGMEFEMVIDDIIDRATGLPLVLSGAASANSGGSQTLSLANHKTIATQNAANENIFTGEFNGTLKITSGSSVSKTDQFRYRIDIADVEFETIYGYFGEKDFEIQSQTIEMDFFDELDGDIRFGSPEIRLIVDNSFGVPMGLSLSSIISSNTAGDQVSLTGSVTEAPQFINAPNINSVGNSATSTIRINNDVSNLSELLNIGPNVINVSVEAQSNYSNTTSVNPPEDRNFVDANSSATTYMEIELPLDLQLTNLTRHIDYSLDDFDFDQADSIALRIKTINQLPLNGSIDLQFLDADSAVIYQIKNVSVLQSPEIPSGGKITAGSESIDHIRLSGEGLDALYNQPTLRLILNISSYDTANDSFVKIYADYKLEIFLGVEATLDIEL